MKIKSGVVAGLIAVLVLFAAFAHGRGGQESGMSDQKQKSSQQAAAQDPQTIMQVQQALSKEGYDPGAADGKMGSKTENALKQYQQAQGIDSTGQLDQQTLASLGVSGGAAAGGRQDMSSGQESAKPDQSEAGGQQDMPSGSGSGAGGQQPPDQQNSGMNGSGQESGK